MQRWGFGPSFCQAVERPPSECLVFMLPVVFMEPRSPKVKATTEFRKEPVCGKHLDEMAVKILCSFSLDRQHIAQAELWCARCVQSIERGLRRSSRPPRHLPISLGCNVSPVTQTINKRKRGSRHRRAGTLGLARDMSLAQVCIIRPVSLRKPTGRSGILHFIPSALYFGDILLTTTQRFFVMTEIGTIAAAAQLAGYGVKAVILSAKLYEQLRYAPKNIQNKVSTIHHAEVLVKSIKTNLDTFGQSSFSNFISLEAVNEAKDLVQSWLIRAEYLSTLLNSLTPIPGDTAIRKGLKLARGLQLEKEVESQFLELDKIVHTLDLWYSHQNMCLWHQHL